MHRIRVVVWFPVGKHTHRLGLGADFLPIRTRENLGNLRIKRLEARKESDDLTFCERGWGGGVVDSPEEGVFGDQGKGLFVVLSEGGEKGFDGVDGGAGETRVR